MGELLPGGNISNRRDYDGVEEYANHNRHPDGFKEPAGAKFRTGFFGAFYDRFKSRHKIGHDLHDQKYGYEWGMSEERREIPWRPLAHSEPDKQREQRERAEGCPVLKSGAQADAAIVQNCEQPSQAEPDHQVRQVNWLACDAIQFDRIQCGKDVARDFAD